ncbi:MAG: HAD family phosphatase, partial [Chloroflexota bacterium]|nr:HAD family phosphatase [Chloroflexota bacterium]
MPIEAIIYDMDGVLVDSEVYWDKARVEFARDRSKTWTDEFQRLAMGRSTIGWARVMQDKLALDEPIDAIIAEMKARVIAHYEARMPARPGALESVRHMKRHFRVGLASGSPTDIIKAVLRITGLDQIFEVMIYGDEVPRGKPAPDIYLEALKQLGVAPAASLGIEDSANGLRSLKAAGMFAVAAPSPDFPLP